MEQNYNYQRQIQAANQSQRHLEEPNEPSKVKFIEAKESHEKKKQKIAASKLLQGQRIDSNSEDQILDKIIHISAKDSKREVQVSEVPIWRDKESIKDLQPLSDNFLKENPDLAAELKARIKEDLQEESKQT